MNSIESARFIGFKRVAGFGEINAADLVPEPPSRKLTKAQQLFGELGTTRDIEPANARQSVIGILGRAAKDQLSETGSFHGDTANKTDLRKKIKSSLKKIRKAGLAIARTQGRRQIAEEFVLPNKMSDALLVSQARAFADAATPLLANFIELEHQPDFIDMLLADVAAFENAGGEQDASLQSRVGAGAAIKTQLERGTVIVKQLDVIMCNKYENNPEKLAAWQAAVRIQHPARGGKKAAPAPVPGVVVPLETQMTAVV